jgi:hypothetical protein
MVCLLVLMLLAWRAQLPNAINRAQVIAGAVQGRVLLLPQQAVAVRLNHEQEHGAQHLHLHVSLQQSIPRHTFTRRRRYGREALSHGLTLIGSSNQTACQLLHPKN